MPFNVPEDQKPEFNKKVKGSLELLTTGVTDKLRQIELESADTLVEAYNKPVSEAELTQVPPSDMVTVDPQMARRIEINSLRMPDGTIYRNANELFSKPVDFNQFQAIGFVDTEGNATPNGELFFNLKEAGMFNEDGTLTKRGQAYSMSERDLEDEANLDAFTTLWDEEIIRPSATWDEQLETAAGFVGNAFGGFTDLMQTFGKVMSVKNAFDVLTGAPEGKKIEAEFQTSGLAAIEKITTNFANIGRLLDVGSAALADTIQAEDVAMVGPGGVPMYTQSVEALKQQDAEAERDLYAARQRQWKQNRDIQSFEVGQIAETVLGLDGAVKMAEDAKNTLGAEEFNKRYSRVGAFSEIAFDPTNLIPASVAFNVAKSVPIATRLTLGAQKVLGRVAQTEAELAKVQAVVQAGNAVLKKEELFVPRYQQLFKNMSAKAADNPELMVRANEVLDRAKQITASADEVRAAMPTAINTLEELTVKRNSLATRIPEAYANKVMQTVELGRRIRSAPARTLSSMLERTGNTLTKVDDAVTTYLKDRGLDQAYNAALGASGVVGLAGNPVVGAIGIGGAALKSGKFLTEYGKILRYVGKEMENARGQIPFWKRVAAHTAPGSLGRGIAHTFNIFELGGATSDIIRRAGRGIAAAYPTDLFFEWLSDGADMRPQTMTQAAAESLVIGGSFAAAGGAFMGTNKRMRELSIGDEINFRQGLTDTKQKALYEALPPGVRRSMATYSIANPTLNYNFIDSGSSSYDINTNTANINVNSTNPLKPLVAHETLHHTLIKNNMEGGIAALFLGDTKTNAVGGLFRSKEGKLDPEFERFKDGYYKRLRDAGMTDAEIGVEFPLDKIAVEYFIDQHADQYATMAETGELGALAARGEVRKKLGAVLETVLPKIPVLRDLHIKSGGAIDANGAWVKGNGILGDDKIRQNPIANRMFREMNRRSSGMMPGQFEPLISDKEGSGAPLMFDPANAIDMELMHPFIQVDENDKPILKDGRPVFIDKSVDIDRAMAGLTAMEAMRKRRESNYAPEKGEAFIDDEGDLQPGWLSDAVLNEMFAKHKFNNEQKRMIRQYNRIVKDGKGQRMVMINFPATTRLKSGKVVYAPQKAAIRDSAPVAITISKDGNILYGLMSVTKLQENIKKRAQSKRGKKLYAGNIDAILQDVQAMMDFHLNRPTEDSIVYFNEKYGVVEGDQRKKFINTMFGLLNKKEQAVLNPMLLEDGVKSADNVYRTYRADRVSKAIPMAPEEYAAMPFSYEAVSQVRMPEAQRAMPEGEQGGDVTLTRLREIRDGLEENLTEREAIDELDFIINDAPSGYFPQDVLDKVDQAKRDLEEEFTTWAGRGDSEASTESAISSVMGFLDSKESGGKATPTRFMPEGISPEDLNPVANAQEAQGRWADGKQMFAINEMDEKLIPITSKAMLESYPADAIGWMEPEAAPAGEQAGQMRFMPEGDVEPVKKPTEISKGTKDALPVIQAVDDKGELKFKDGKPVPQIIPYNFLKSPKLVEYDKNNPTDKTKPNYAELAYDIPKSAQKKIDQAIDSGAVDAVVGDVVKRTKKYLENPEIAAGMGWYSRMRVKLVNALGEKGREILSQLLGATSARTPVRENFLQAMDAYEGINAGRYEPNRKAYIDMLQLEESGTLADEIVNRGYLDILSSKINDIEEKAKSLKGQDQSNLLKEAKNLKSLINQKPESWKPSQRAKIMILATDMLPKRSNGKKFNANSLAVLKVIHGSWLDNRNAPKTPNFAGNLSGRTLQATIDVWAARFLRAVLYEDKKTPWRIQPKAESAVTNEDFAVGQIIFERAAKKLKMNPDDLQAVLWFAEKDRWDKMGWTQKVGAEKSSFDDIFSIFFPDKQKPLSFEEASAKLASEGYAESAQNLDQETEDNE
jgi:hypothetical protein